MSSEVFWERVGAYNEAMWPIMALPKCFGGLDCWEDCILFASGVYGLVELVRNRETRQVEGQEPLVHAAESHG